MIFVIETRTNINTSTKIDVRTIGMLNSIFRKIKNKKKKKYFFSSIFLKTFLLDTKKLCFSSPLANIYESVSKGISCLDLSKIFSIHSHVYARIHLFFEFPILDSILDANHRARPFNQYRIPITLMILTIKIIFACKQYVNLAATRHKRGEVGWMGEDDGTRWNRNINRGHS